MTYRDSHDNDILLLPPPPIIYKSIKMLARNWAVNAPPP